MPPPDSRERDPAGHGIALENEIQEDTHHNAEIAGDQGGIVIVIAPLGDPDLDLAQVLSRPVVSMLIAVPRGRADYAAKWTEFWTSCGAYVIAQVDDACDLHLFEAALARRRDEIQ